MEMLCGGVELFQQLLGAREKLLKQFWGRSTSATGLKPSVNESGSNSMKYPDEPAQHRSADLIPKGIVSFSPGASLYVFSPKAPEDWRSPKAVANSEGSVPREASWTAPVLWRFVAGAMGQSFESASLPRRLRGYAATRLRV